jgi:hypothetical protein
MGSEVDPEVGNVASADCLEPTLAGAMVCYPWQTKAAAAVPMTAAKSAFVTNDEFTRWNAASRFNLHGYDSVGQG